MKIVYVSLLLLLPLAGSPAAQPAPSVDDIIAAYMKTVGGLDRVRTIQTLRRTGRFIGGGGFEAEYRQENKRPNKARDEFTLQGLTGITAYDGKAGWKIEPWQGKRDPESLGEDEMKSILEDAEFEDPLFDYRAKGNKVELLGTDEIEGTKVYKIRATLAANGDVRTYYMDADSYVPIRIDVKRTVRGEERETEMSLGDYKEVNGWYLPFALESGPKGSQDRAKVTWDTIEPNVPIDDRRFERPPQGAPAQKTEPTARTSPRRTPSATSSAVSRREPPRTESREHTTVIADTETISGLGARNIGSAAMSGRIAALDAVHEGGRLTVYVGSASGGVWKSMNGGTTFKPVFDQEPVQSVGAVTVDPSNPKVIWVGTGESWTRNSVSIGDGIYKSTDGGATWTNMGLRESERIVKILVDPAESNTVYACVPGKLWSDSTDRGVYRTTDGGRTWTKILAGANPSTGCSMMSMDPKDSKTLFAGMWDFRRKGWTFRSGGDGPEAPSGSGLFKSTDGGATWAALDDKSAKGLPPKPWGRVAVAVAPSNAEIVYAFVEAVPPRNALYRSADGGQTWETRDRSQNMVWRPFYFANLIVDPRNEDRVYKPDLGLVVSNDGGASFSNISGGAHGDFHDVWIDPANTDHLITGDDGGLWYSYDAGNKWWKAENLPLSQFYHVSVDMDRPYKVYGGLQDNSSWVGESQYPGGISNSRWENMYGGDGFWMFVDPTDADYIYAESQGGYIGRVNRKTHETRDIKPLPAYKEPKLRFNWNTPIHISATRNGTVYIGAQYLFRSRDFGQSWERISADLTTSDSEKQKQEQSGGITVDNSSAEMHTTIYAIAESPSDSSVIWAGTDDGNLQVTRDGGKTWTNVVGNISGLTQNAWVSSLEAGHFDSGTVYATFDLHTLGDMRPYAFKSTDYGKSWVALVAPDASVRGYAHVIKEDPVNRQVLFLGTELGLWVTLDGGANWSRYKGGDFPAVAVRDLAIHPRDHDLVVATHGRGIWIIDDITPLRTLSPGTLSAKAAFVEGRPVEQRIPAFGGWVNGDAAFVGPNPPGDAVITYYQQKRHIFGDMTIEVFDSAGKRLSTLPSAKRRGLSRVTWSMRLPPPRVPPAASAAFGAFLGPRFPPGTYTVKMTKDQDVYTTQLRVAPDPRSKHSSADRTAQYELAVRLYGLLGEMTDLVDRMNAVRAELDARVAELPADDALASRLRSASAAADEQRKTIVATKEGGMITGEERLREFLAELYGSVVGYEGRPSDTQVQRADALARELADVKRAFETWVTTELSSINALLAARKIPPIGRTTPTGPSRPRS
jgi:photosystem II stability/assembly factor-like uncharacterized protein